MHWKKFAYWILLSSIIILTEEQQRLYYVQKINTYINVLRICEKYWKLIENMKS